MDYSLLFAIRRVEGAHSHGEKKRVTLNESIIQDTNNEDCAHGDSDSDHEHDEHDQDCDHDFNPPREEGEIVINEVHSSHDGHWAYQVAVIDYLQTFDRGKKQEVCAKRYFKNANPMNLSAVPPDYYAERFRKFMKESVFAPDTKSSQMDTAKMVEEITDHIKKEFATKLKQVFEKQGMTLSMSKFAKK